MNASPLYKAKVQKILLYIYRASYFIFFVFYCRSHDIFRRVICNLAFTQLKTRTLSLEKQEKWRWCSSEGIRGRGPKEGADGEAALLREVSDGGEAVLGEEAVELPLGHGLVVGLRVPRVVKRHLEVPAAPLLHDDGLQPILPAVKPPVPSPVRCRRRLHAK